MANAIHTSHCLFANDGAGYFTPVPAGDPEIMKQDIVAMVAVDADLDGDVDLASPGRLFAYQNLYEAGSVTSPAVAPAQLYPTSGHLVAWQHAAVQELLPANTDVRYEILDAATGEVIPGFADLRPDAAGQINLSGSTHRAIRRSGCAPGCWTCTPARTTWTTHPTCTNGLWPSRWRPKRRHRASPTPIG